MKFLFRFKQGDKYTERIVTTPPCPTCQELNSWEKLDEERIKCKTCGEIMKIKR